MERLTKATTLVLLALAANPAAGQSLRGSRASVDKQYRAAIEHEYSFLQSASQVRRFAGQGLLVSLSGNADYELAGASWPFARPAVKTFVERLSRQYRAACGEPLVVTSLTRPAAKQPRNASDQSVHPAGMAVDLRISRTSRCRSWIERVLLSLEKQGVLEATRERFPAHYHVAVFPNSYLAYIGQHPRRKLAAAGTPAGTVLAAATSATNTEASDVGAVSGEREFADAASASLAGSGTGAAGAAGTPASGASEAGSPGTAPAASAGAPAEPSAEGLTAVHRVGRGDTLWSIARRYGATVAQLKALNGLDGSGIQAGQRLRVPAGAQS
jgi:LysM repeat protein